MSKIIDDIRNNVWAPTEAKDKPEDVLAPAEKPDAPLDAKGNPGKPLLSADKPKDTPAAKEKPTETPQAKPKPEATLPLKKEMPKEYNPANTIFLKGEWYEIKPTRFKYFRNKAASAYDMLKAIPLSEYLTYDKGVFDPERDADQILFDFLVAVFDDKKVVMKNYDDFTAADLDKILEIFGRLNGIEKRKEEARKNREAAATR